MADRLRIGIVGTGGMGKIHAAAYMKNPRAEVRGVSSLTRELAQEFADGKWETVAYSEGTMDARAAYRIPVAYGSWREMAADAAIQAVSIVVPNALHHEIALAMIRAGKHVLVEKPLALNAVQAAELVNEARRRGVVLATGHMWRFHREVEWMRQVVADGVLGEIVQTKSYGLHLRWGPSGWFTQPELAGGGALIDMGVHAIDTTRWLLGEPAAESVYAVVGSRFGEKAVDDFAQIMVRFAGGTTSLFESGWHFPRISGLEASTELWGTKGYARLFPSSVSLRVGGKWGTFELEEKESHTSLEPYAREVDDFVSAVVTKGPCRTGYETGLEVMRIVDAAYRSARENAVVKP
jgi:predicted dehydrogenase